MHCIDQRTGGRVPALLYHVARLLVAYAETDQGPVAINLGRLCSGVLPLSCEAPFSLDVALRLAQSDEDRLVIQHLAAAGYHLRFQVAQHESPESTWYTLKLVAGYSAFPNSLPLTETHCEPPGGPAESVLPSVIALALKASLATWIANGTCSRRP
jgi:hypothetical protein